MRDRSNLQAKGNSTSAMLTAESINETLRLTDGRVKQAAEILGVGLKPLRMAMRENGINWKQFRKAICFCRHAKPRCEGCREQNRVSQIRARKARKAMMSCRPVTETRKYA